jgi:hypothetical protein
VQLKWGAEWDCAHSIFVGIEFQAGNFSILNDEQSIAT